jgi:hypothetical protein
VPPEPSYLVERYGEIENEIDNLDNLAGTHTGLLVILPMKRKG